MVDNEISIFWNHVGREHEVFQYANEIKKNSDEIKNKKIELCIQKCKQNKTTNRFIKYNSNILIETPNPENLENFIIVYCIDTGLQFSLNYKKKYSWWLIDIVDIEEVGENIYCVHDLFIDISVEKNGTYRVLDIDEFEYACSIGVLTKEQITKSIKSLANALNILNANLFPQTWLKEIVLQYQNKTLINT